MCRDQCRDQNRPKNEGRHDGSETVRLRRRMTRTECIDATGLCMVSLVVRRMLRTSEELVYGRTIRLATQRPRSIRAVFLSIAAIIAVLTIATPISLANAARSGRVIGSPNVDAYCQATTGSPSMLVRGAVQGPNFAHNNWKCARDFGTLNMTALCKWTYQRSYPDQIISADARDANNAYSWECRASSPTARHGSESETWLWIVIGVVVAAGLVTAGLASRRHRAAKSK